MKIKLTGVRLERIRDHIEDRMTGKVHRSQYYYAEEFNHLFWTEFGGVARTRSYTDLNSDTIWADFPSAKEVTYFLLKWT